MKKKPTTTQISAYKHLMRLLEQAKKWKQSSNQINQGTIEKNKQGNSE